MGFGADEIGRGPLKENREKKLVLEHKKYISRLFKVYVTNQWIYTVLLMNVAPVYSFPIQRFVQKPFVLL